MEFSNKPKLASLEGGNDLIGILSFKSCKHNSTRLRKKIIHTNFQNILSKNYFYNQSSIDRKRESEFESKCANTNVNKFLSSNMSLKNKSYSPFSVFSSYFPLINLNKGQNHKKIQHGRGNTNLEVSNTLNDFRKTSYIYHNIKIKDSINDYHENKNQMNKTKHLYSIEGKTDYSKAEMNRNPILNLTKNNLFTTQLTFHTNFYHAKKAKKRCNTPISDLKYFRKYVTRYRKEEQSKISSSFINEKSFEKMKMFRIAYNKFKQIYFNKPLKKYSKAKINSKNITYILAKNKMRINKGLDNLIYHKFQ